MKNLKLMALLTVFLGLKLHASKSPNYQYPTYNILSA